MFNNLWSIFIQLALLWQKICVFFYFYTFNQLFKNEKLNLINNIYVI